MSRKTGQRLPTEFAWMAQLVQGYRRMMNPDTAPIAALVRHYRDLAGLTQEDLAERAGISYRSVSDIERGVSRTPYQTTVRRLADALGLVDEDRAKFLASVRPANDDETSPPQAHNLPVETFALIGREREEAEAVHSLRFEDVRLLTLTGPGGVGKTRLALRLAHALERDFAEIHLVSLATLTDAELVPAAIAGVLEIEMLGGTALEDLMVARLSRVRTLLIVDNLEHLLPAVPLLGRLLARCPDLRVLATSRAPLRLRDEHELAVPPLALPESNRLPSLDVLRRYPSVELFYRRVRAVRPEFQLTESNASVVANICIRLEGLPLALELAAARMRALSPTELLLRLNHRLHILTDGAVDLPQRQRTMRDTIAWSYELLSPALQTFFRRLAVFSGGADMDALERVLPGAEALDLLTALVETSLIRADETDLGETRYSMLEIIREFALEMLATDPEEQAVRERHAEFCAWLSKTADDRLSTGEQGTWLARLEREHNNMRSAIDWTESTGRIELGLRVASPLWRFWSLRGYVEEGSSRLARLLEAPGDAVSPETRSAGLYALAALAFRAGKEAAAREVWLQCLEIDRIHADSWRLSSTLNALGSVATTLGEYDEAEAFLEESRRLAKEAGWGDSAELNNLGNVARYRGRFRQALALYREAMDGYEAMGRPANFLQQNMALVHLDLGEYDQAIDLLERSIARSRETGNSRVEVGCLCTTALVYLERGDARRAYELGHEAVERFRALENAAGLAKALHVEARALATIGTHADTGRDLDEALALAQNSVEVVRGLGQDQVGEEMLLGLGYVHLQRAEIDLAHQYTERALDVARSVAWGVTIAEALNQRAHIARLRSDHAAAVRWHGEAAGIREALGTPIHCLSQRVYATDLAVARDAIGEDAFERAWSEGTSRVDIESETGHPTQLYAEREGEMPEQQQARLHASH